MGEGSSFFRLWRSWMGVLRSSEPEERRTPPPIFEEDPPHLRRSPPSPPSFVRSSERSSGPKIAGGGFFVLRGRRSKIKDGGILRSSEPKIEEGGVVSFGDGVGCSSIFGSDERRIPPFSIFGAKTASKIAIGPVVPRPLIQFSLDILCSCLRRNVKSGCLSHSRGRRW